MASEQKRMQLRGLHHVTAICRDLERTVAFYRDLMGLAVVLAAVAGFAGAFWWLRRAYRRKVLR